MSRSSAEIRRMLLGPVNSIPTPFLEDGAVDWRGVRQIAEMGIAAGSSACVITPGDSQYDILTPPEIRELTRVIVDQVRGRALTVSAVFRYSTANAVEFAHYCRELGVDCLMVLPTERLTDPAALAAYYKAVAQVMPVMLVGYPPAAVLERLVDTPEICAFKEDGSLDYAVDTMAQHQQHWRFLSGGGYWRHYTQRPFGCRAYFSYLHSFRPALARAFSEALSQPAAPELPRLLAEIEAPLFRLSSGYPGGFQAVWRALLELNGVAARWLRQPYLSLAPADLQRLAAECRPLGLVD